MNKNPTDELIAIVRGDSKTRVVANIIRNRLGLSVPCRALVVGCGTGLEAAVFAHELQADVTGIDIAVRFDPRAATAVDLRQGDATRMEFDNESFDFVYSFHALEHIPDYHQALRECQRVLRSGGAYCIGTPNRNRLIGYIGGRETTLWNKVQWNLVDWRARLLGRFRNEYGEHAGFTSREMQGILLEHFSTATNISTEYYKLLYPGFSRTIAMMSKTGLNEFLFPAVYFLGRR